MITLKQISKMKLVYKKKKKKNSALFRTLHSAYERVFFYDLF